MLGKHALEMLSWTRYRTRRILDSLPASLIHVPIEGLSGQPFNSPAKILEHVVWAEKMYMRYVLGGKSMLSQDFTFDQETKKHIWIMLDDTRQETVKWLEGKKDIELNNIMFNKRTHMGWVFYHLAEHEAHHVGQIVVMALINGHKVPNV